MNQQTKKFKITNKTHLFKIWTIKYRIKEFVKSLIKLIKYSSFILIQYKYNKNLQLI